MPVTVFGRPTCSICKRLKSEYRSARIPFQWHDISLDRDAAADMWRRARTASWWTGGSVGLPIVDVDGTVLERPSVAEVFAAAAAPPAQPLQHRRGGGGGTSSSGGGGGTSSGGSSVSTTGISPAVRRASLSSRERHTLTAHDDKRCMPHELLATINYARTRPRAYARLLEATLPQYDGKIRRRPGHVDLSTVEGAAAVREAVAALRAAAPSPAFVSLTPELCRAAAAHCADIGPRGVTGHTGADGSSVTDRVTRYGQWLGGIAENISFANASTDDIVQSLLVDDGVKSRGHRKNLLNPTYKVCGVAVAPHARYHHMCVMVFCRGFRQLGAGTGTGTGAGADAGAGAAPPRPPLARAAGAARAAASSSSLPQSRCTLKGNDVGVASQRQLEGLIAAMPFPQFRQKIRSALQPGSGKEVEIDFTPKEENGEGSNKVVVCISSSRGTMTLTGSWA